MCIRDRFIGTESGGATRWLDFGFVSFQPSDIAKFGVICSFAAIMAAHTRDMKTIRYGVAPYVVILGIIAVLLYLEPHMSATLIILCLLYTSRSICRSCCCSWDSSTSLRRCPISCR